MNNLNVQQRKFVIKAGMTTEDVKNTKEATAMQKKYASAFDTDGKKGFSQKEADLFNATIFSEKADGTVTFWTRQKDGTKIGTKYNSKDNNIQFKLDGEVKPYFASTEQCNCKNYFDNFGIGTTINDAQKSNCVEQFYLADLDGDGTLSKKEISVWTKPTIEFNWYKKDYEVENRTYAKTFFYSGMTIRDIKAPSSYIKGRHWGAPVRKYLYPKLQAYLEQKFNEFDKNGDGVLSEKEMKDACENKEVLKQYDGNGSPMFGHKFGNGYQEKYGLIKVYNAYVSKHPIKAFFKGL